MKKLFQFAVILAVPVINQVQADPPTCATANTKFDVTSGSWFVDANWTSNAPTSTMVACIPDGKTALIHYGLCNGGSNDGNTCTTSSNCPSGTCDQEFAVAGAIVVDDTGVIEGYKGGTLTLHGKDGVPAVIDSTVDGSLELLECTLELANDVTIHGDGGVMKGEYDGTTNPTIVKAASGATDPTLTLEGANNASVSTSLKVHEIWTFQIDVVNNAYVIADLGLGLGDGTDRILFDDTYDFSGSGIWMAVKRTGSSSHGRIEIQGNMTESATLRTEGTGEMDIHANASFSSFSGDVEVAGGIFRNYLSSFSTTGDVTISSGDYENKVAFSTSMDLAITGGKLMVEYDYTTTGDLDMDGGSIVVSSGKIADFSN